MKKYILLYSDRKEEDNICLCDMFKNNCKINIGWTNIDYMHNRKIIEEHINNGIDELIFSGLENGWDKLIIDLKDEYKITIKVICTTQDGLLYDEYERNNFFRLLELSKKRKIDRIAFLRKGQYDFYKSLGYKCYYLLENFSLDKKIDIKINKKDEIYLGVYPLSYNWNKNIFNQLCIAKMLDNCKLFYNNLDERMDDFINTMNIKSESCLLKYDINSIIKALSKNDVVVSCAFTDYLHPIFFIAMELGIPCLVGNTVDFLDDELLLNQLVTNMEDSPVINSNKVKDILSNREEIIKHYKSWKNNYNSIAMKNINGFINI